MQEVEKNLLMLLQLDGGETIEATKEDHSKLKHDNSGYGPVVPGVEKGDIVNSQEDVDDLLSSLGF